MIRRTRTRPIVRFTPINQRHPSAGGIVGVINGYDRGDSTGTCTFGTAAGRGGGMLAHQGNGSSYLVKTIAGITQNCSLLLVSNASFFGSSAGNFAICGIGNSGAGNQLFQIAQADLSQPFRSLIRTTNGAGFSSAESNLGSTDRLDLQTTIAVYDGTANLGMWRNGSDDVATRNNVGASGSVSSYDRLCLGGIDRGTDVFSQAGQLNAMVIAWNRALSAQEAIQLSGNPWQLFEPEVIYVRTTTAATFKPAWAANATSLLGSGVYA